MIERRSTEKPHKRQNMMPIVANSANEVVSVRGGWNQKLWLGCVGWEPEVGVREGKERAHVLRSLSVALRRCDYD